MNPIDRLKVSVSKLQKLKNFDLVSFSYNFQRLVDSLYFFHNVIGKNCLTAEDLSKIQYSCKTRPKEGQVAYFYIEHSYPKEIYNSHWCLVLKDFGNVMLVAPLTSIKSALDADKTQYDVIVKIKDFIESGESRLRVNQIFSADTMRIDANKGIYELETDFESVKNDIEKIFKTT
ncbi:MAG: hypothetical protein NC452_09970 [Eubacterium sp.]|nr:hypothetical protein [Eubacterium sp.]